MHVDHCIESLRLSLMCYGDVTPVLIEVAPDAPLGRRADFNVHHKCRNFEKLTEWVGENGEGLDVDIDMHGVGHMEHERF